MKVAIILGSSRDGRLGERIAKLVTAESKKMDQWDVKLLDLKEINLQMYHDAVSPGAMHGKYADPIVAQWGASIAEADAFIFITPEYNHSIPAVLKNAIDTLYPEWANKAGGIVSYSTSVYGGARAVEHLRGITGCIGIATVQTCLSIASAHETVDPNGVALKDGIISTLQKELDQIDAWGRALMTTRK